MLHEAAIKPWQYEHWIFPRDPAFAEKARPILDLYAGFWEGQPLGTKDYVLSLDEKTSIQARRRCHEEMPPEAKAERGGSNPSMSGREPCNTWHRGTFIAVSFWGGCEAKTGIQPFGRLVDQVLGAGTVPRCGSIVFSRGQRFFPSWSKHRCSGCGDVTKESSCCTRPYMRVG